MKNHFALLATGILLAGGSRCFSQNLNWGGPAFSDFADSAGNTLDNTFVFELGAFSGGFEPTASNVDSWFDHWQVFDRAFYNGVEQPVDDGIHGYITNWSSDTDSLRMLDDGTSNSPHLSPGALSFEGLSAFLWVRKGDEPVEGSEWLLTRADAWVFPTAVPGCCDEGLPVEWSLSDLDVADVPTWGKQGVTSGSGVWTENDPHTLQTYTFVPEPSSALLTVMAGLITVLRRRRTAV